MTARASTSQREKATMSKAKTAPRTRLGGALAKVKQLQAEAELRAAMFKTSQQIVTSHEATLARAASEMRAAADQFDARGAKATGDHLRIEAGRIDAAITRQRGEAVLSTGMRQAVEGLGERKQPHQER
jgi:hypothetical protein